MMQTDLDYDAIAKVGSMLGSGAVIVMDETTCMVRALERLSYFYYEESCGQCTPCRKARVDVSRGAPDRVRPRRQETSTCSRTSPRHHGTHDLRPGRCGGAAGKELRAAFPR